MYKKSLPPIERLLELLSYNPETGELWWKAATHHNCSKGVICPGVGSHGYKTVTIDCVSYLQHRIIWAMQTGCYPPDGFVIDHIDENPSNNRWDNLRLLDNGANVSRSSKHKRLPIIVPHKNGSFQCWKGRVYVGRFATEADALEADPAKAVDRRKNDTPIVRVRKGKSKSGWEARVYIDGKRVHLGTFPTRELALQAPLPKKSQTPKNQC